MNRTRTTTRENILWIVGIVIPPYVCLSVLMFNIDRLYLFFRELLGLAVAGAAGAHIFVELLGLAPGAFLIIAEGQIVFGPAHHGKIGIFGQNAGIVLFRHRPVLITPFDRANLEKGIGNQLALGVGLHEKIELLDRIGLVLH